MAGNKLVVYLEASTVEFSRGIQVAGQQLTRFEQATQTSSRGLVLMERGLQQLAFRAAGIPGVLGKVTEGFLSITGFTGPLALATGGVAAFALAWDKVSDSLELAHASQLKFARDMRDFRPDALTTRAAGGRGGTITTMIRGNKAAPGVMDAPENTWFSALLDNLASGNTDDAMLHGIRGSFISAADWRRLGAGGTAASLAGRLAATNLGNPFGFRGQFAPRLAGEGAGNFLGDNFLRDIANRGIDTVGIPQRNRARFGAADAFGTAASGLAMIGGLTGRSNAAGSFLMGAGGLAATIPGGQLAGGVIGLAGALVGFLGHHESAAERQVKELEKVNAKLQEQLEFMGREEVRQLTIRLRSGAINDPRTADALARIQRDAKDRKITLDVG